MRKAFAVYPFTKLLGCPGRIHSSTSWSPTLVLMLTRWCCAKGIGEAPTFALAFPLAKCKGATCLAVVFSSCAKQEDLLVRGLCKRHESLPGSYGTPANPARSSMVMYACVQPAYSIGNEMMGVQRRMLPQVEFAGKLLQMQHANTYAESQSAQGL